MPLLKICLTFHSQGAKLIERCRCLLGLKIKQGKEILLPDYICDSVLYPIEDLKLRPVFYSTSEDLTPEWNVLEDKITSKTAAIVMVNFFGQPQEIESAKKFVESILQVGIHSSEVPIKIINVEKQIKVIAKVFIIPTILCVIERRDEICHL